jgi:hypothetical protein
VIQSNRVGPQQTSSDQLRSSEDTRSQRYFRPQKSNQ